MDWRLYLFMYEYRFEFRYTIWFCSEMEILLFIYECSNVSSRSWISFWDEMLHWTHSSYWQCAVKPSTSAGSDLDTGADPKDIFPAKLSDSLVSSCLLIHFGTIVINLSSVPIHFVLALVLDMFCKLLFSWN